MEGPSNEDLMQRWLLGEGKAGEEICRRYAGMARRYAARIAGQKLDADDLAQEALAAGLEGIRGGSKPHRITFWLQGVVRNIARARFKEKRPVRAPVESRPSVDFGPATRLSRKEVGEILDREIADLPAGSREVMELHREGRSREEIGRRLGLSMEAVHARFLRSFKQLREGLSRTFTTLVVRPEVAPVKWGSIAKLRPSFRNAIVVRHLEERGREAAAKKLRIPLETLDARLDRAYRTLQADSRADFSVARREWQKEIRS